ncbi:MAG: hypothetical protein AABO57_20925 [Acidobacteriota bacterium]
MGKKRSQILSTETSEQFITGMLDRMVTSYHKYGPISDAYPRKVNALESLNQRIEKYLETGNTEWLIDAANFAMIEFMYPAHPKAHFRPTDSEQSPGRTSQEFDITDSANDQLGTEAFDTLLEHRRRIKR